MLGYGPIEQYLADPTVTEVMVNAQQPIYVERGGKLVPDRVALHVGRAPAPRHRAHRRREVGRRIDESSPMVDARLADGSRVNAIIPPLAIDGPALTIRKFAKHAFDVDDLVRFGTLTARVGRVPRELRRKAG